MSQAQAQGAADPRLEGTTLDRPPGAGLICPSLNRKDPCYGRNTQVRRSRGAQDSWTTDTIDGCPYTYIPLHTYYVVHTIYDNYVRWAHGP